MQTLTFKRKTNLNELVVVITATEPLAILNVGGYIADYFGNPHKATLRNLQTNIRQSMNFSSSTANVLSGVTPLSSIVDGVYVFEGWIEDLVHNRTIIGSVQNPSITALSTVDVSLRITSNLGTGAIFDVSFHNLKPVNINVDWRTTNLFDTKFADSFYYNTRLETVNSLSATFTKKLYYNFELLPEVDPLLP